MENTLVKAFKGRRVLITGDTGFKGGWLSIWLNKLGASVYGLANSIPTKPSLFEVSHLDSHIKHEYIDVQNLDAVKAFLEKIEPDFIFHLAAQSIVSVSYESPISTLSTNIIGSANLLEAARLLGGGCRIVMVTSDKCYENKEWNYGYRETDSLGGKDPYSASKACAEIVISSYCQSFFNKSKVVVAAGRAGNVIGGGDWSRDRVVADAVRSWTSGKILDIRNPRSTRPWQHVLEPLSGYLSLAVALNSRPNEIHGQSFNFGPTSEQNKTVEELVQSLSSVWGRDSQTNEQYYRSIEVKCGFKEAGLLKLNCDKALAELLWMPTLNYEECVEMVGTWYSQYYKGGADMYDFTISQINKYEELALRKGIAWAQA
jgi:CDP-glucose 4,6-dehydratase